MRRLLNSYIMRLLENKITLITGAGRGIGRVIAEQFAKDGATVYVNDLQEGDMATWADDCASRNGVKVVPVCFDVTDSAALKAGLMSIYKAEGRIDCVVNNAATRLSWWTLSQPSTLSLLKLSLNAVLSTLNTSQNISFNFSIFVIIKIFID